MDRSGQVAGTVGLLLATAVATGAASAASSGRLALDLNEFHIAPTGVSAKAGAVRISVANSGKKTHELIVATSGKLPVKSGRVDEAALERAHRVVGEIADIKAGRTGLKTFKLKKGSYTLFCNLPGHYTGGMHATLVVR